MTGAPDYLRQVVEHGFESFELTNWAKVEIDDLEEHAKKCLEALNGKAEVSSVGIYGNPLTEEVTASEWIRLIKNARHFGCNVVCGFAGAIEDKPIDENMTQFAKVFSEIARVADGEGVKIAFENCDMGGTWERPKWNIAHAPRAWRMMFDAVPSKALGLEWNLAIKWSHSSSRFLNSENG